MKINFLNEKNFHTHLEKPIPHPKKKFLMLTKNISNIQPKEKISYNYPKNNNFPNKNFLIPAQKT